MLPKANLCEKAANRQVLLKRPYARRLQERRLPKTTVCKTAKRQELPGAIVCEKPGKGCARRLKRRKLPQAILCGKTVGSERCGKAAVYKEIAKANAEDSCEMMKARGTMCKGKEAVSKEIAKGE